MRKNNLAFILGLCPLIPCSSHFAYGILIVATVWFLFFVSVITNILTEKLEFNTTTQIYSKLLIVISAVFLDGFIRAIFPIAEIAIRFYIFITAFSYILVLSVKDYDKTNGDLNIPIVYSVIMLLLSFCRELLAFGSLSLPSTTELLQIQILPEFQASPFRFFGSTAGAFILLGIALWIYFCINKSTILPFKRRSK